VFDQVNISLHLQVRKGDAKIDKAAKIHMEIWGMSPFVQIKPLILQALLS